MMYLTLLRIFQDSTVRLYLPLISPTPKVAKLSHQHLNIEALPQIFVHADVLILLSAAIRPSSLRV